MKLRSSIAGLGVLWVLGCSTGGSVRGDAEVPKEPARVLSSRQALTGEASARGPDAAKAAPRRDLARANELAAGAVDDRFTVVRQVTALERAIELYQTFIERAGDDPRYAEAVRRSQGRIEDAKLTICFLLEKPCDGSENR